jgi:hypothetical protein
MGESFGTLNVRVTLGQKSMGKGGMEKMYTMREKLTRNCQYIQKANRESSLVIFILHNNPAS